MRDTTEGNERIKKLLFVFHVFNPGTQCPKYTTFPHPHPSTELSGIRDGKEGSRNTPKPLRDGRS